MADIIIRPQNYVFSKIEAIKGILHELWEDYSFFVPGYIHMPKYKYGRWDGKIRLFNIRTRQFYNGLLPNLVSSFAKRYDYTVDIQGEKHFLKPTIQLPNDFDFQTYTHFTPKNYQLKYLRSFFRYNRGLIHGPTGSGKSLVIYLAVRYILDSIQKPVLIIVTQTNLAEQMASDFSEYTHENISDRIQTIYSGQTKKVEKDIVISTWQSIYTYSEEWFNQFSCIICDEAHHATAASLTDIIRKSGNVPILMGLTGTIDDSKHHRLDLNAKFCNIIRIVKTDDLIKSGDLTPVDIQFLRLVYDNSEIKHIKAYDDEIKYLISNDKRNDIIINKSLEFDSNVLILFNYIEKHGKKLYDKMFSRCIKEGKNLYYISGETAVDEREIIRNSLEKKVYWYEFELENGGKLLLPDNIKVKLSGSDNWKKPESITRFDEIDDRWLEDNQYYHEDS